MKHLLLVVPALMLSAASSDESGYLVQPGQWEVTTRVTSVEAPGLPDDAVAQIRNGLSGNPPIHRHCITPAEAVEPLTSALATWDQRCQFSERMFAEGRIRVRGVCPGRGGQGQMHVLWEGGYSYTTMSGALTMEFTGSAQDMRLRGSLETRRIGDCSET